MGWRTDGTKANWLSRGKSTLTKRHLFPAKRQIVWFSRIDAGWYQRRRFSWLGGWVINRRGPAESSCGSDQFRGVAEAGRHSNSCGDNAR